MFGRSIHQLNRKIGSHFHERIALSRNTAAIIEKGGGIDEMQFTGVDLISRT